MSQRPPRLWSYVWQHAMITLLVFSLVACTTLASIATEVNKYEPVIVNVATLACSFTPAAPECALIIPTINTAWATFYNLLTQYEAAMAAGTETVALYNDLNAAFQVFEQNSQTVLNLAHVFNATSDAEALAIVSAAQILLSVIEDEFPGPPAGTVTAQARVKPFGQYRPLAKINNGWAKAFFQDYNRKVKACEKRYPNVKLQEVPGVPWW